MAALTILEYVRCIIVACPRCGAKAGEHCKTKRGPRTEMPHAARYIAFEATR